MLAEQGLSMHPLTQLSSPVGRFSLSHDTTSPSSGASRSPSNQTDSPHEDSSGSTVSEFTPVKSSNGSLGEESMSPLERLQYFGQNTVFSHVFQGDDEPGSPAKSLQNDISTVLEDKHRLSNSPGFGLTHEADEGNSFGNSYALPKADIQSDHTDLEYMGSTDENGNRGSPGLDKPEFEAGVAGSNVFQCPICRISCSNRHQFNDHIVSHSHQRVCPKCTFSTTEEEALKVHLQEAHGVQDPEAIPADDEIRVPKVNSQGKLKTFKCKQCEYTAVTKLDFWEHSKSHIRPEKMLSCPKCPFVTEYKHHLEYHLRNHFDSKPFKCTKCQYSCVNKSMLNSHLKSHSSVYQYRCADCAYATKYCHSLKLHLRKYKHEPSMVLNLDGTPNPLPIIDVYGTRRGPKIKRTDLNGSDSVTDYNGNNSTSANSNLVKTELVDSPKAPKPKGKRATGNGRRGKKYAGSGSDEAHTDDSSQDRTKYFNGLKGTSASPLYDNSPKATPPSSVETFSPRSTASDVETGYPLAAPTPAAVGKNPMELYAAAAAVNQYLYYPWLSQLSQLSQLNPNLVNLAKEQQMILAQFMNNQNQSEYIKNQINQGLLGVVGNASSMKPYPLVGGLKPSSSSSPPLIDASTSAPLDLRHPKLSPSVQAPMDCAPINLTKRKRKMKTALRNSKSVLEDEHDSEVALDFSKKASPPPTKNYCAARSSPSPSEAKMCKYCEISFPDQLLYSVHMSFHSSSADPFLCKSCGKRTQDKLSFFVHLTTAPH